MEGVSELHIVDRSRGIVRVLSLGNVNVGWLLEVIEALFQAAGLKYCVEILKPRPSSYGQDR